MTKLDQQCQTCFGWGFVSAGVGEYKEPCPVCNRDPDANTAKKFDDAKPPYELVPPVPLAEVVEILQLGAEKYGPNNYLNGAGLSQARLYGAVQRHLAAYAQGVDLDDESGLSHLGHAVCGLLFMMELQRVRPASDDLTWRKQQETARKPG